MENTPGRKNLSGSLQKNRNSVTLFTNKGVVGTPGCGGINNNGLVPGITLIDETYLPRQVMLVFYSSAGRSTMPKGEMMMADSNLTKRALAAALRKQMETVPFEKVSVGQICEACEMNRKSFYYHFKDKYDLVNWIFDTEFISLVKEAREASDEEARWLFVERACVCFFQNRKFYRSVIRGKGQNSFSEHLREFILPLLQNRLAGRMGPEAADDFTVNFFADAILCALERWLLDKNSMPPEEFVARLKRLRPPALSQNSFGKCPEDEAETEKRLPA